MRPEVRTEGVDHVAAATRGRSSRQSGGGMEAPFRELLATDGDSATATATGVSLPTDESPIVSEH